MTRNFHAISQEARTQRSSNPLTLGGGVGHWDYIKTPHSSSDGAYASKRTSLRELSNFMFGCHQLSNVSDSEHKCPQFNNL